MKALLLHRHGSLDDVSIGDIELPDIGVDEVLLEVKAAALNRLDLWVLAGWPRLKLAFPHILGCDGSGIISTVGEAVTEYKPGDRVAVNPTRSCGKCAYCRAGNDHMCDRFAIFGEHVPGFYAQYQAVPARNLLKLPDDLSHDVAAAASLVYVTAWHSLIEIGRLQAGEDVLVVGAAGGVNLAAIDIARLAGAGTIFVVGSDERKLSLARQQGAHMTINRLEEEWGKVVFQYTNRQGVDIVIDNVGAATFQTSIRSLKKGGRLLTVGNTSGPKFEFDNRYIFGKHLSILGSTMGPHGSYEQVMSLIFKGRLNPIIDAIYPLAEGIETLRKMERGEFAGKMVLHP